MKKNLLLILITFLSAILSACGADTQSTNANFPSESESGFYEDTLGEKPSFELLQKEITLECGVPFNTDDLSKYIKAENYDDIKMYISEISRYGEDIEPESWSENYWATMGREPQIFEIEFSDSVNYYSDIMIVTYEDTIAPVITLKEGYSDEFTYYQLHYNDLYDKFLVNSHGENEMSPTIYYDNKTDLISLSYLVEHDHSFIKYFKSTNIIANGKVLNDYADFRSIINEFPTPGTYTIELAFTDFGNNTGTFPFTLNIIGDIPPKEKESLSEEKYQQLYNDYIAGK